MEKRNDWRGSQEWRKTGLPFSTTSDEALKLFDALFTQYLRFANDDRFGGIVATVQRMLEADPTFILGHVVSVGAQVALSARMSVVPEELAKQLEIVRELAKGGKVTDWERKHAKAVDLFAAGYMNKATAIWDEILFDYPLDIIAMKFAFDVYLFSGNVTQMRDKIARIMPYWTPDMPLYWDLYGYYAMCLCETNLFAKAEKMAKKGLELNPYDSVATHSMAHVYEMEGRYDEGLQFLASTVKEWEKRDILASHTNWHWAVFMIEKADYEGALEILDREVITRNAKNPTPFAFSDSISMLERLELQGVNVGDRWQQVHEMCARNMFGGNVLAFFEAHFTICAMRAKHKDHAERLLNEMKELISTRDDDSSEAKRTVGIKLSESIVAYHDGQIARAVELLYPLRYDLWKTGGSIAQRDLLNLFLIQAATDSPEPRHNRMARGLLNERKGLIETSQLTDRLLEKVSRQH